MMRIDPRRPSPLVAEVAAGLVTSAAPSGLAITALLAACPDAIVLPAAD